MMSMPEDIKLLLLQRPELKRWFDPITGHYRVPRVKVRSQKSQERALSRLSESATSSLGFSCDDFEVVAEANKLNIPVIAIIDNNSKIINKIDYPILSNTGSVLPLFLVISLVIETFKK